MFNSNRKFETALYGVPKVVISQEAHDDMWAIVQAVEVSEVGWYCTVSREGSTFYIEEVYLPEQEAHATTCELTGPGQIAVMQEAKARDLAEQKDATGPTGRRQRMKAWFHSHVNMGVSPSGQDETQFEALAKDTPFFIRGIANKKGEMKLDIIMQVLDGYRVKLTDVEFSVAVKVDSAKKEFWAQKTKELVKSFNAGVTVTYPQGGYAHTPNADNRYGQYSQQYWNRDSWGD